MTRQELSRAAAVLGLAALALTAWVDIAGSPVAGDLWITRHIQDLRALRENEVLINVFGDARLQLLSLLAFGIVCAFGHRLGLRAGSEAQRTGAIVAIVATVILRIGSGLLKPLVDSPRPSAAFGVRIDGQFDAWGFPSSHVYTGMLVYGTIAVLAPVAFGKRAALGVRVVCIAIVVLSGPARVVVGAHWPSDTVGGYLWGGAALCLALCLGKTAERGR